jgi:predicted Zn finger-like uncharacterized protein
MSIATMCPHCETKFSLSDGLLGKRVRCKKCNAIFEVVESVVDAESAPTGMRSGSAPPRTSRPEAAARPKVRRDRFEEEEDERFRRRESSSRPNKGVIIGLSVGGGLLLLAIIGGVVWACLPAKDEPPVADNHLVTPANPFRQPLDIPQLPQRFPDIRPVPPQDDIPVNADPITRAVAGLKSDDFFNQSNAAKTLERTKVEEGRRAEVVEALKGVIDNRRPGIPRREAVRPLAPWGTKADTPYLVRLLDDDDHGVVEETLIVLGKFKDGSAAQAIAEKFPQFHFRRQAGQALKDIGPAAEEAVVPLLNNPDHGVRVEACKILKAIGTTAISQPTLVQLAEGDDRNLAQEARNALPAHLRPPVYTDRQTIKVCVVNGARFPQLWPQVEARFKALADSPTPKCKVSTSGDTMTIELAPVNSNANTFARKINFARVTAVHPDQRLIYAELR